MERGIVKNTKTVQASDGEGAKVRRCLPGANVLDPFLMMDEYNMKAPAGFPDHPHRGFETVTYVLSGSSEHEDFAGHRGKLEVGDLQWMTAGRGIMHAEMPFGTEPTTGLQLWINLPSAQKMIDPCYQELKDKEIPRVSPTEGVDVKVIAGEAHGITSKVYTRTPTMYLDYKMEPEKKVNVPVPTNYRGFLYVISGAAKFGVDKEEGNEKHVLVLSDEGDHITATTGSKPVHFVFVAGQPLKEPVFQMGPFVMASRQELEDTIHDYRTCRNGFERAQSWRSEIGNR